MRWRADKLNAFVIRLYQRLKTVGRQFLVSNAPIVFPFSYVNYTQEYPAWLRAGALDLVNPQIYRRTAADYEAELNRQLAVIPTREGFAPGIDITNSNPDELVRMIEVTRAKGLAGAVIWYFKGLQQAGGLERLKQTVYALPARMPWVIKTTGPKPDRAPRKRGDQPNVVMRRIAR